MIRCKSIIVAFILCAIAKVSMAQAKPVFSNLIEDEYGAGYQFDEKPIGFFILDKSGVSSDTLGFSPNGGVFVMRIARDEPVRYFSSAELNDLIKHRYEVDVFNSTTLHTKNIDYFIVQMTRRYASTYYNY